MDYHYYSQIIAKIRGATLGSEWYQLTAGLPPGTDTALDVAGGGQSDILRSLNRHG